MDFKEFLFSKSISDKKKLETINALTKSQLQRVGEDIILRIINECKDKSSDRLWIDSDRRVGNHWNSTIEFIYEYNGRAYVMFYVQNTKTDSSSSVAYNEVRRGGFSGYCEHLGSTFRYDSDEAAEVVRCILAEYAWWLIERPQRERAKQLGEILHYRIYNPVVNYFYDQLRLKYESFSERSEKREAYRRGEKAVKAYADEHLDELYGKSDEELKSIYKEVFRKAM